MLLKSPTSAWGPADPANRTCKYSNDKTPSAVETAAWSVLAEGADNPADETIATLEGNETKDPSWFPTDSNATDRPTGRDGGAVNTAYVAETDKGDISTADSGSTGRDSNPSSQELKGENEHDSEVAAF